MYKGSKKNWTNSCADKEYSCVSFSKNKSEINFDKDFGSNDEDIQVSLAAYMPTYLAQGGAEFKCCGLCFPVPFERASKQSWWDPKFDSEILEGQFWQSAFPQIRLRFRYSLVYLLIISVVWSIYLLVFGTIKNEKEAYPLGVIYLLFSLFCLFVLWLTRSPSYRRYQIPIAVSTAVGVCLLSLASVSSSPVLSPAGDFAICTEILVLLYTVIPLPLYACVTIGCVYSGVFEWLGTGYASPVRILSHVCIHLISLHIFIMTSVRMRGTFMKVGQSLLVRKQLEMEKQLKEKMILSVMPPKVADWLMSEGGGNYDNGIRNPSGADINSLFRPFNMSSMKDVSILFADIVGFTRMSSKKTASQLVAVLNELFERFDDLCSLNGCEKISTLGDCYYCVSGCPEPRPDHAQCCVHMGLGMIEAISEFDKERKEEISMRVGVHTGSVLCGIVGRRRFKFDVWSNDVTLANKMESTGMPGRVHISHATKSFLNDQYLLEPGEPYMGMETYFILEPKEKLMSSESSSILVTSPTLTPPPSDETSPTGFETAQQMSESVTESLATARDAATLSPLQGSLTEGVNGGCCEIRLNVNPVEEEEDDLSPLAFEKDENQFGLRMGGMEAGGRSGSPCRSPTPSARNSHTPISSLIYLKESLSDIKATSLPTLFSNHPHLKAQSHASLNKNNYSLLYKYSPVDITDSDNELSHTLSSHQSPLSNKVPNLLEVPRDDISYCQSNSRKDSGIKSTSRRSSIQQQLFVMNGLSSNKDLLGHRVSGYYTSSRSSINADIDKVGSSGCSPPPLMDSFGECFQKLRKQSDLQLIKCVQDNSKSERSYFVSRELKKWSLKFKDPSMEIEYREKAHRTTPDDSSKVITLATARFNTYFDISIAFIVFVCICVSSFIILPVSVDWTIIFVVLCVMQCLVVGLCLRSILRPSIIPKLESLLRWYPWQGAGAILVSMPMMAVLTNFRHLFNSTDSLFNYCYLFYISMVHYCNFTQLNCWMKSSLATVGAVVYLILVTSTLVLEAPSTPSVANLTRNGSNDLDLISNQNDNLINLSRIFVERDLAAAAFIFNDGETKTILNATDDDDDYDFGNDDMKSNNSFGIDLDPIETNSSSSIRKSNLKLVPTVTSSFPFENLVNIVLLLLMVWFLNREFEISYRLSFHGNAVAARDKAKVQSMRDQADILLHNIIPRHVVDQLKNTARYSEDVKEVGIIFASIVNFSGMYDESYLDGRECLRVLNELISDFDELLNDERFSMVEKIKTIGSTFMAASGLNLSQRESGSREHLRQLMEFAIALQKAVDNFNTHLLEFSLVLRVGYNVGDVTAGVVGTTKLFYDIWGDAVNIASRMDSTGVAHKIQLTKDCVQLLSEWYSFEPRGTVFVKGKDNMEVYLMDKPIQQNANSSSSST